MLGPFLRLMRGHETSSHSNREVKMAKAYYMLFTREGDGYWHPQFGDYSRTVVYDEVKDTYASAYKAEDRRVRKLPDDSHSAVILAQWLLNHPLLRKENGLTLQSYELLPMFGLKPHSPIPPDFSATRRIGMVEVTIVPQWYKGMKDANGRRLPKRRVLAQCPLCQDLVCAGHLDQHIVSKRHRAIIQDPHLMEVAMGSDVLDEGEQDRRDAANRRVPKGWDKIEGDMD